MIYEFCAENVTNLEKAMQAGARRIELCDNLAVGGTTPSYGVIKAAVELAKPYNVTVMTMIRPRGGDFVYNDLEMEIMLEDIQMARSAGTHGLVFGVLTTANKIDYPKMEKLLKNKSKRICGNEKSSTPNSTEVKIMINHGKENLKRGVY